MRRILTTTAIAVTALLATACGPTTSSVHATPSERAAAAAAYQQGVTVLEQCTPNGKTMIGGIVHKTATPLTYVQAFHFFKSTAHRVTVWACATKHVTANIPGTDPKTAMETCFAKSSAATTTVRHPFHAAHHPTQTAEALLNAAAICVGQEV
jgi:hypothetical protein